MKNIIKTTLIIIFLILNSQFLILNAQVAINSDGTSPDASAMLEISSTDKGILIPRMDSTSRQGISSPATGLMVYDSTTHSFWYYTTTWVEINTDNLTVLSDVDGDTKIQVEENSDEDIIRFDLGGTEFMRLDSGRVEILNTGNSVFIGHEAGKNDDYSENINVFVGDSSGYSNTSGFGNTFLGASSGFSNTTAQSNTFLGGFAGYTNTTGYFNTFTGAATGLYNTTGYGNTFTGASTGPFNTTGILNTFTGMNAGYSNTTGDYNTFIGSAAGIFNTTGQKNTFLGTYAGYSNTTGANNVFVGYRAGLESTTADRNIFVGYEAGYKNSVGNNNVYIGNAAGYYSTGSYNIFIGSNVGKAETGDSKLYIDHENTTTPLIYGDFVADSLQINGTLNISGNYNFPTTDGSASQILTTDGSGTLSWIDFTLENLSDADGDTKIQVEENNNEDIIRFDLGGTEFMRLDSGRIEILNTNNSIIIGDGAGENSDYSTASNNLFLGYQSGHNNDYGYSNIFLGTYSGLSNTSGLNNIFTGANSGQANTTGNYNIFTGPQAGYSNTTGNNNISIGLQAGYSNLSGEKNIFLGFRAGYNETGSNKLYIESSSSSSPLIYGDFDVDSLQINGTLNISGNYAFPTTDGNANQTLTTDGSGTLSWTDNNYGFTSSNGLTYSNSNSDDFLFGTTTLDHSSGTESKFFFDNSKAAFRAGAVTGTKWDESNIGDYSFAVGYNTTASGDYSFALGNTNTASGDYSIVLGLLNTATGSNAISFGAGTQASGNISTTFGVNTTAKSYAETALGAYNTDYTPNNTSGMNDNDRLLVVGNGTSSSNLSDALIIYKSGDTEINGNLGIGTTASNGKLEIDGYINNTINNYTYVSNVGNTIHYVSSNSTDKEVSIYASDRIVGKFVISLSDERIKDIQGISDSEEDLAILNQIQITDYQFKDKVREGNTQQKKVIAQQVAEVFPQAVEKQTTEIIPDIYQTATIDENGWVSFNYELGIKNYELKVGEKVQIIFDNKKELLEVLEVKGNTFRVKPSTVHRQRSTVFIYGRQVHDFHTVDYQAISMLNVSATQQLAKENEALKKRVAELETQLQKVNELEVKLEALLNHR